MQPIHRHTSEGWAGSFRFQTAMALEVLFHVRMLDGLGEQLEKYMDLLAMRQKLVASNIANADTPGYRTKDIGFQFEFQSAQAGLPPDVIQVPDLPVKNDGNDVNLEREARLLSENDLRKPSRPTPTLWRTCRRADSDSTRTEPYSCLTQTTQSLEQPSPLSTARNLSQATHCLLITDTRRRPEIVVEQSET